MEVQSLTTVGTQEVTCSCPYPPQMSKIQPKLGQQDGASRGGLTRSAVEPLLSTLSLGRVDLGLPTSHHVLLSSEGLHTFKPCLSGKFGQNRLTASEVTGSAAGPTDSRKDRQHALESPISMGQRYMSR